MPGYIEKAAELEAAGVKKVYVYCCNDGAVMKAWGQSMKTEGTIVELLGDPDMKFTNACGMAMPNAPAPLGRFRCKRWVCICVDGVVKQVVESFEVGCEPGDCDAPAGPIVSKTCAPAILELAKAC